MYGQPRGGDPTARYGWLGAKQRSADTPDHLILMGVRIYNPGTGRFLTLDRRRDPAVTLDYSSYRDDAVLLVTTFIRRERQERLLQLASGGRKQFMKLLHLLSDFPAWVRPELALPVDGRSIEAAMRSAGALGTVSLLSEITTDCGHAVDLHSVVSMRSGTGVGFVNFVRELGCAYFEGEGGPPGLVALSRP